MATAKHARWLLGAGVLSSAVYVALDVASGLLVSGYSFRDQAISELSAVGAPTQALWRIVGPIYDVLVIAFGLGVLRVAGANRRLSTTGALLVAFGLAGVLWMVFPMHERGAGLTWQDVGHIVLAASNVVFILLYIGFGAAALRGPFRTYSLVTMVALLVAGAWSFALAPAIASGTPTPWLGAIERVNVYGYLLWVAVFAIVLLKRDAAAGITHAGRPARIDGFVAPGFEEVRAEFARNFTERGEIGAAVAAWWKGVKVVDLWGGSRTPEGTAPWTEDTMVPVASSTKGMAAMTLAVANARGWLDYDAPVARYWPEFAQHGKEAVTVRQLLGHEAGLVLLDGPLPLEKLRDLDYVAEVLARQRPAWRPGTRHGYHTMSIGLYMQEIMRRADPAHRTIGRVFRDEIAVPLGLDFHIGLPADVSAERIAALKPLTRRGAVLALRDTPPVLIRKLLTPHSLLRRSMLLADFDLNDRRSLEIELPAGNGVGTARALARAYAAFADGGAELGITPETFARVTAPPRVADATDAVIGIPSWFSLGFLRPGPEVAFGSSERAFGSPGAGGSFAFADPDARLGYAYVMNRMGFHLVDDPREKALRDAVYRAIARQGAAGTPAASAVASPREAPAHV